MSRASMVESLGKFTTFQWFAVAYLLTACSWTLYFADHALLGLVPAVLLAGYQAWLIRRRARPADWLGASCIGQLVLCLVITLSFWSSDLGALVTVTVAGTLAHALQWAAVKQAASKPAVWFLGAPSLGVAVYVARQLIGLLDLRSDKAALLFGSVSGLIVAVSSSAIVNICIFQRQN